MGNIFGRDNNGRPFTGNVYNENVTYCSNVQSWKCDIL